MDDLDLDELLKPNRWTGRRCYVAQALDEITDPEIRGKFVQACDDMRVPARRLLAAFTKVIGESPLREGTLQRHQRRNDPNAESGCGCH